MEKQESNAVEFIFQDTEIHFLLGNKKNVMVNATEMAKAFEKKIDNFLRLEGTKSFVSEIILHENQNLVPSDVRKQKTEKDIFYGTNKATYFHRVLALKFAAWLDPKFELWIYSRIEEILFGKAKVAGERISELALEEEKMKNIRKEMQIMDNEVVKTFFVVERNISELKKNKNQAVNSFVKQYQPTLFDENLN